jgi:hypothetical protein
MLQRGGVDHDIRGKVAKQRHDARLIADIGERAGDAGLMRLRDQFFGNLEERRLRTLDDQQLGRAEGGAAQADLGADRAAAAGDDDALAFQERAEPVAIDLDG